MESRTLKLYDRRASLPCMDRRWQLLYQKEESLCSKQMMMLETRWMVGTVDIPLL